ncbi:methionyl-tRNA formyltransferase [Raoultibacter phocaeensis]|uniref:methionyl-tRNA formyltransferase n=1 Tax=Raoultibacter phocaeensis TaxID=2479841 RepID=UPI001119FF88|nr:methionyl-tRNA formyltransferase [Raoultibacter phocaeensis]
MRIVFMGTPEFAATILEDLVQQHDVAAVYTRPDAVRGRGSDAEASPVKRVAERYGIEVRTPKTLRDEGEQHYLASLAPEVICVAAYGMILPKEVLEVPPYGCINVHASLLPAWRGAAPVERAILADETETGVCVMQMEEGLDTGAYCICRTANIEDKGAEELTDELANLGSHALLTALVHIEAGVAEWTRQDDTLATYAHKIEKHELDLSPDAPARELVLKVQASGSAHPSRAVVAGRAVTVLKLREVAGDEQAETLAGGLAAGSVRFAGKRLFLGAADGAVEVLSVKPDGKKAMDAKSFAAGIQGIKGDTHTWGAPDGL